MLLLLDTLLFHLFVLIARAYFGDTGHKDSSTITGPLVQPTTPPIDLSKIGYAESSDEFEEGSVGGSDDWGDSFESNSPRMTPIRNTDMEWWYKEGHGVVNGDDVPEMQEVEEHYAGVLELNMTAFARFNDLQERLNEMHDAFNSPAFTFVEPITSIPPLNNTQAEAERVECCNKHLTHPYLKNCSRAAELALVESEMPTFTTLGYTQPYAEWSEGKKRRLGAIAALGLEMIGIDELIQSEMCTSKGEDHTQCCVDVGMTSDCVQLCNGTMTMEMWKQQDTGRLTELAAAMVGPCRGQLYKIYEC